MTHPTSTTELEGQQASILPAIKTALATTTQLLGKPHNILAMGRAGFIARPSERSERLEPFVMAKSMSLVF